MNTEVSDSTQDRSVAVVRDAAIEGYPSSESGFAPDTAHPEYTGPVANKANPVYSAVRACLAAAGMDRSNYGLPSWNPLGSCIRPGETVLVKPNLVRHSNLSGQGLDCLVTHPAVLKPVLDYVLLARPARVIVGDAPVQGCDMGRLLQLSGHDSIAKHFAERCPPVEWVDFRMTTLTESGIQDQRAAPCRTEDDYIIFDLGKASLLQPLSRDPERFRVTMYNPDVLRKNHGPGVHRYAVAREAIAADVIVSVPKLKTHTKVGITAALKNTIGICGRKDFLPHHRKGSSLERGDCYAVPSRLKSYAESLLDVANRSDGLVRAAALFGARRARQMAEARGADRNIEGNWHGNDTIWRTCLDLNRILMYGREDGTLSEVPQRRTLFITDAIVAGEGEGPLSPVPRNLGTVTCSTNPVAADYVHAHLVGFDWRRLPVIREGFTGFTYPLAEFPNTEVTAFVNGELLVQPWAKWSGRPLVPPAGWRGYCELS